jgi:CRISPR-associated protein Cmr3
LRAAAVDAPLVVSGWDLAKRGPKPARRAVPAGATYFYSIENRAKAEDTIKQFHFNESLYSKDGALGYGIGLFGLWRNGEDFQ